MSENAEVELAGPDMLVPYDDPHRETLEAEKSLWRRRKSAGPSFEARNSSSRVAPLPASVIASSVEKNSASVMGDRRGTA